VWIIDSKLAVRLSALVAGRGLPLPPEATSEISSGTHLLGLINETFAVAQRLRRYAASCKVAGSRSDEVNYLHQFT
jgi:hypothetical protein